MALTERLVIISGSADAQLRELAEREQIEPDVFLSLVAEMAIRERHEQDRRFAEAARKVLLRGD